MGVKGGSGGRFESEIAQIFRSAGYSVEQNVEISGQEFDIVASRREFGNLFVRIAVECKFRTSGSVSNQDVFDFITSFRACADGYGLTFGFLVTNRSFSRQAHEAVRAHPKISLMSDDMLEDELLGARTYLENTRKNYRTDFVNYIELRGSTVSLEDEPPIALLDVARHCRDRLSSMKKSFTVLLGDFGSGKTTLAEQTHSMLAENFLTDGGEYFPLILYLRTLEQFDTEHEFIESHLKINSRDFGISSLEAVARRKKLALILDGFDEVAANASEEERMRLFSRAMRVTNRGHSVLLTSRPSYFDNFEELVGLVGSLVERDHAAVHKIDGQLLRRDNVAQAILDSQQAIALAKLSPGSFPHFSKAATELIVISPLDAADIIRFLTPYKDELKRHYGKTPEQIYTFLTGIYDLTDLLTRPLLLDMFLDLLRARKVDLSSPDMQIGPAGLYSLYINYHLTRDWDKRRFLLPEERLAFARAAALAMLESGGSLEATYASVLKLVTADKSALSESRRHLLETDRDGVITDVRVCSFMNVTAAGRIEFSHKSFMEYFVADVIAASLGTLEEIPLLTLELNYEILYFLGSFALLKADIRVEILQQIQHVAYSQASVYRTNLLVALLFSEQVSEDREFENFEFSRIRIARKGFNNCVMRRVTWRKAIFAFVNIDACELEEFAIEGEVSDTAFRASSGAVSLPATCERISIEAGSELVLLRNAAGHLRVSKGDWTTSKIVARLDLELIGVTMRSATLTIEADRTLMLDAVEVKNCVFVAGVAAAESRLLPRLMLKRTSLQDNTVVFLQVSRDSYIAGEANLRGAKGVLVVQDAERQLLVFRSKGKDDVTRYRGWDRTGSLFLVSSVIYNALTAEERGQIRNSIGGHEHQIENRMKWNMDQVDHIFRKASERLIHAPSTDSGTSV